jgi:hypothetical protein
MAAVEEETGKRRSRLVELGEVDEESVSEGEGRVAIGGHR